jgi:hypothetical protein
MKLETVNLIGLLVGGLLLVACTAVASPTATPIRATAVTTPTAVATATAPMTASAPTLEAAIIEWVGEGEAGDCATAAIAATLVAHGPCDGPFVESGFGLEERPAELADLRDRYAPFTAATTAGQVTFRGQGTNTAAAAEQRMIAEWSRLVALEAAFGRSGASWGLALVYHREGGIVGFCDDVTIYVTGVAHLVSCQGGEPRNLGTVWLNAGQLAQLYEWVNRLQSFEYEHSDASDEGVVADAMTTRLLFSGGGTAVAGEADRQEMEALVQQLLNQAAAPR